MGREKPSNLSILDEPSLLAVPTHVPECERSKIFQSQSPSDEASWEIPSEATKRTVQPSLLPPTQLFKIIDWLLFQTSKFGVDCYTVLDN